MSNSDTASPFSWAGRFSRLSFLAWHTVLNAMLLLVFIIIAMVVGYDPSTMQTIDLKNMGGFYTSGIGITMIAMILLFNAYSVIFSIRRLHDTDLTGWWSLLGFIPFLNLLLLTFLIIQKGTEGTNRFGSERSTPLWEKVIGTINMGIILLFVVYFIILMATFEPSGM